MRLASGGKCVNPRSHPLVAGRRFLVQPHVAQVCISVGQSADRPVTVAHATVDRVTQGERKFLSLDGGRYNVCSNDGATIVTGYCTTL